MEAFRRNRCAKDGLAYWCRQCEFDYRERRGNRERQRAYNTEYYQKNSDKLKAYSASYAAANPELKRETDAAYRAANRDKIRAWHREYRKTPARAAAEKLKSSVRRALKSGVTAIPFTAEQLEAKWRYWNGSCWVCGDPATTWDHVKPLQHGGAHALVNLRPACFSCNSAKNSRWPLPTRAMILGFCG